MGQICCNTKFWIQLSLCLLSICTTNAAICRRMVIFGDSISDNGVDADNDPHGFKQFSNGPTWPDYLARKLGVKYGGYSNMAYSGGLSGLGNYYGFDWSGVKWQVEQFIQEQIKSRANQFVGRNRFIQSNMVVIQAGGINDIYLENIKPEDSANNLKESLKALIDAGVMEFVVLNVIDISKCPGEAENSDMQKALREQTSKINQLVPKIVKDLQAKDHNINIIQVDVQNIMDDLIDSGNFVNQKFTYSSNNTLPGEAPRYLWFDEYHPASFAHEEIAKKVYEAIKKNTKSCRFVNF